MNAHTKPSSLANPTDIAVAQRLGEYELTRIRMGWMLEQQQQTIAALNAALVSKDTLIAARDQEIGYLKDIVERREEEIKELRYEPELPMTGTEAGVKH